MENEAGFYINDAELQPPCSKWGELYPELQPLIDAYKALEKGKKDVVVSFPSTFVLIKMVTWEGDVVASHATRAALRVLLEKRGKPKADERVGMRRDGDAHQRQQCRLAGRSRTS